MNIGRSLAVGALAVALLGSAAACGQVAAPARTHKPKVVGAVAQAIRPAVAPPAQVVAPAAPKTPPPPIPILMYHVIAKPPSNAPWPGLYVTAATFTAQMAALHAAGYHALTMRQAYDIWQGRAAAPAHPVVLSFDNGYTSQFTRAVPILKGYGWPGVLNLVVDRLNIAGGLTTAQVKTMIADGWEVETQGLSHADLAILSPQEFAAQTVGAAEKIRTTFGVPVRFFCYPSGDYNPAVIATLRKDGFLGAVTVWPGFAMPSVQGALSLDRVRVSYEESAATLLGALRWFGAQKPSPPPVEYPMPVVRQAVQPAPAAKGKPAVTAAKPAATADSAGKTAPATSGASKKSAGT